MKRWLVACLLTLGCVSVAWAGGLELDPPEIGDGGVTWLRWKGAAPVPAVARLGERSFPLQPDGEGLAGLVGVDLQTPPGSYPIQVRPGDASGVGETLEIKLQVRAEQREVERLTLPPEMVTPKAPEVLERIEREAELLQVIYRNSSGELPGGPYQLPVDSPLGSPFGLRRILNGEPRSPHSGVDFRSQQGTPIHAPTAGRVAWTGDLYYTGSTVVLDHGGGLVSIFAHLSEIAVEPGQTLQAGERLGAVGSSGRATGPHLHWSTRLGTARVDPLAVLAALRRRSP